MGRRRDRKRKGRSWFGDLLELAGELLWGWLR
jgi:hypothetical protein